MFEDSLKSEYLAKIFKAEFKLLKTLEFDVDIDMPLNHLDYVVGRLYQDQIQNSVFMTMCKVMANESMRSIAPLCVKVVSVTVACVVLAAVVCGLPRPQEIYANNETWWKLVADEVSIGEITQAVRLVMEAITLK